MPENLRQSHREKGQASSVIISYTGESSLFLKIDSIVRKEESKQDKIKFIRECSPKARYGLVVIDSYSLVGWIITRAKTEGTKV